MNDSMTHWLHLIHYWMNQCFWTNLLDEWFNDSLASLLDESVFLNKSIGWMIQWLTDFTWFITGWISVSEQIYWMNDSMTHWLHVLHYWMNQCFWTNLLDEWFNDSLASLLDESVFLNKSIGWMIQWLTHWLTCFITGWISVFEQIYWMNDSMTHSLTHLLHYWMNQCFWTNLLDEWFTDFITGWISVFEQISWMNDSMTHVLHYWMNHCFWTNLLDEWFNDSLTDFTCFITGWISVFEQIYWMNDSMTQCFITGWIIVFEQISWINDSMTHWLHLIHYWMNQCFWTNLLDEWFNDSLASLLDESLFLNKSLGLMIQWLTDFTWFITGWISVFEQISWMNDSMTHVLHYWMNHCFWTNLLD